MDPYSSPYRIRNNSLQYPFLHSPAKRQGTFLCASAGRLEVAQLVLEATLNFTVSGFGFRGLGFRV